MHDQALTLGRLAEEVRSKNAGPFWQTIDVFLRSAEDYQALIASRTITPERISELYLVPAENVEIFQIVDLCAIKISFPRRVPAGSFEDRDQHAGQQHVPLASLAIPSPAALHSAPDRFAVVESKSTPEARGSEVPRHRSPRW